MGEKLDAIEVAMNALDEAIDAVEALGKHYECDVLCLQDMKRGYKAEYDELHAQIEAKEEAEESALEREYWKAVI